ncbi:MULTISPECIES: septation regulator SpoVG [Ruminococcus]|jgi:stage V sporulation protein G|uniref:Putative septation protein SpoVG n=1 Tax=Ruminococcus flavefaciens TaxID=1265 RepID=A0A315XZA5_RUMFL|nr:MULTISPECIES: septation regulator SpoVG [Ruminococcus]MBQ6169565.1 septation regulator SpoVG [Ruminococcus sp.]MBQ6252246.1 septation regulator SpoVG [Ruminococcus sp.]MBR1432085.1 septation regulator SpoVG [Ruminococcus sp.]MBR3666993.1 septation regulator SpoVG [Ruminococcus sp.]MBR6994729.1 septation regulator SpoVG [Ruminococcus sp.]
MEITDVKIRKIMSDGRLRAVVSVTIDDMFAVHDIKVVQGDERLFVAMPSRKDENGVFRDIVHPISPSARKLFEENILDAYERQLAIMETEASEEANEEADEL